MAKQINKNRQSSLLTQLTILFMFGAFTAAFGQDNKSIGAKYGTRDPRTCEEMKAPAKGVISSALATKYFICAAERIDGQYLILLENVKVEVGAGRPYNPNMDINVPEIDVRFPLYPIRGSHTLYQCKNPETDYISVPGKTCHRYEHKNAKGSCYKTTFGDWRCYQTELFIPNENITLNVPPPTSEKAAETKTINQPAETKNVNQPDKTENKTTTEKDANGIVKPDFSELDKDFEIIRYEFDTSTRPPAIYIIAKVKKPNGGTSALNFEGRFYDADGANIMLPAERVWAVSGDTSKAGEVVKLRVWTPSEQQMQNKVKKIVIARKTD